MNKKGLSGVIATLLMVLLVVIAVSLVWFVIRALLSEGEDEINSGNVFISLKIEEAKIQGSDISVRVERRVGKGDLSAIKFILTDGQDSEVVRMDANLEEFGRQTFNITPISIPIANIKSLSIAPVIASSSGEENVGNILDEICVPKVCASFPVPSCGFHEDGCGDTLACVDLEGTCNAPLFCSNIGECVP